MFCWIKGWPSLHQRSSLPWRRESQETLWESFSENKRAHSNYVDTSGYNIFRLPGLGWAHDLIGEAPTTEFLLLVLLHLHGPCSTKHWDKACVLRRGNRGSIGQRGTEHHVFSAHVRFMAFKSWVRRAPILDLVSVLDSSMMSTIPVFFNYQSTDQCWFIASGRPLHRMGSI